ncbi:MAG: MetQ/NlpA family ABC transporter substrate-binding protein [Bacillota bacterium]|nr:MetQ/NlpA family ABC transporter substrate-binding protein [Bacillota bacterium]
MNAKFYRSLLALSCSLALLLAGCQGTAATTTAPPTTQAAPAQTTAAPKTDGGGDRTVIRVGATPVPHARILEAAKPLLADKGYELEIIEFTDYIQPNAALVSKDLDANFFQHQPYLDDYNQKNGSDLVGIVKIHFEPLTVYAGNTKALDKLSSGAKVGVPNDTTNEARALQLLQANDLLKLREGSGLEATKLDITENPLGLEVIELAAEQITQMLPDLDIAVINGNYALTAGLSADLGLVSEDAKSEAAETYGNVLAIRKGDDSRPEIAALIEVLTSDAIRDFINETFPGAVVPVF